MASNTLISRLFPPRAGMKTSPAFYSLDEIDAEAASLPKTFFGGFRNPVGIEVEYEGARGSHGDTLRKMSLWKWHDDGSLKDSGKELVSTPIAGKGIDLAFAQLELFYSSHLDIRFSHRCSIHVHQNVSEMTVAQVDRLVRYYALLEYALFSYCDPLRKASPFCVPITELSPEIFHNYLGKIGPDWKYTAMNLAPIGTQTTVEYRHLEGTKDLKKIRRWVQILCKLQRHAIRTDDEKERAEFSKLLNGDLTPIINMLGVHFGLFALSEVEKSVKHGLAWVGSLKLGE